MTIVILYYLNPDSPQWLVTDDLEYAERFVKNLATPPVSIFLGERIFSDLYEQSKDMKKLHTVLNVLRWCKPEEDD